MTLFRAGASCAVLCLLAACTSPSLVERGNYYADTSLHARGADARIRFLVMHYTESDEAKSLRTLTGDSVSVHYVIRRSRASSAGGRSSTSSFRNQSAHGTRASASGRARPS